MDYFFLHQNFKLLRPQKLQKKYSKNTFNKSIVDYKLLHNYIVQNNTIVKTFSCIVVLQR